MKIKQEYFDEFIKKAKYKEYKKICKQVLLGEKKYSLNMQPEYDESESLQENIKNSIMAYTSDKDTAIDMYKDFVAYLSTKGIDVDVEFPPIPNNSFERLMFIAKFLQDDSRKINELPDILWVSDRTINDDLKRLRGTDPIQVCGKVFSIPDTERKNGTLSFASTAHPVFLIENLTQIIIMLKGLKAMSENPMFEKYAIESAAEIWNQLSDYARKRIRFVLGELMPEEYEWYVALEQQEVTEFHTEKMCSRVNNEGPSVVLDCIKNGKAFCVEYKETDSNINIYTDCVMIDGGYQGDYISVKCSSGEISLYLDRIIRSAYTIEELLAE